MAIIPVPADFVFTAVKADVDWPAQVNRSEWARGRRVRGLPGLPTWYLRGTLKIVATESAERKLRSFKMRLRGVENTFKLPVAPNQFAPANPTVVSVGSDGRSMTLSSGAGLLDGMYGTVVLPSGLHRLFVLTADASGSTIVLEPELPEAPAGGTAVEFRNPYALVSQIETRQGWDVANGVTTFAFDTEEAA